MEMGHHLLSDFEVLRYYWSLGGKLARNKADEVFDRVALMLS